MHASWGFMATKKVRIINIYLNLNYHTIIAKQASRRDKQISLLISNFCVVGHPSGAACDF